VLDAVGRWETFANLSEVPRDIAKEIAEDHLVSWLRR